MRNKRMLLGILIGLSLLSVYVVSLARIVHEQNRRSLQLRDEVAIADHVYISITVMSADPAARLLTARLRLRLAGNLAKDAVTPKINLRLHVNSSPGQQRFEFPKGERMTRIEATFPLEGDLNKYPFDNYESNLGLSITTPRPSNKSQAPQVSQDNPPGNDDQDLAGLDLGTSELERNVPVPLSISLSASTPGISYTGEVIRSHDDLGITRVHLNLKRPYNVINISLAVMCLMMGLAISVLAMVLKAIASGKKFEPPPIFLCMTLIFGLPALRNMQPGIPPVGVLGDYFSFIWAEVFVAAGGIIIALTWVLRSGPDSTSKLGR